MQANSPIQAALAAADYAALPHILRGPDDGLLAAFGRFLERGDLHGRDVCWVEIARRDREAVDAAVEFARVSG